MNGILAVLWNNQQRACSNEFIRGAMDEQQKKGAKPSRKTGFRK
jgi:hypothetical protein